MSKPGFLGNGQRRSHSRTSLKHSTIHASNQLPPSHCLSNRSTETHIGRCLAKRCPGYEEPDETVYIPGRNIILITLAAIWCSLNNVNRIVIGSLAGNPFPDATPEFRQSIAATNSMGLAHDIEVDAPLSGMHKEELLAMNNPHLPLHLTLTCGNPHRVGNGNVESVIHCGSCNKCRERHEAYIDANINDDTRYANLNAT